MASKSILNNLIGITLVKDNESICITDVIDDSIEIKNLSDNTKTILKISEFQNLILTNYSVYSSDETDDLIPLIKFIEDI